MDDGVAEKLVLLQLLSEHESSPELYRIEDSRGRIVSEHEDIHDALRAMANRPNGWLMVDRRGIVISYRGIWTDSSRAKKRNSKVLASMGVKNLLDLDPRTAGRGTEGRQGGRSSRALRSPRTQRRQRRAQ